MQVITKRNKVFIGIAALIVSVVTLMNADYYSAAALFFVSMGVLTTIDKNDTSIKNAHVYHTINLVSYIIAVLIWFFAIFIVK
jgi:hypothetical protein